MKKKIIAISIITVVILSLVVGLTVLNSEKRENAKVVQELSGKRPEEIRNFFESEKYHSMKDSEKRRVRRQLFRQRVTKRINDYFELPENKRKAYLDKMIDEMLARREEFRKRRQKSQRDGRDTDRRRSGRRQINPDRMRLRTERTTPEMRAKFNKFREDMRKRMKERGIDRRH